MRKLYLFTCIVVTSVFLTGCSGSDNNKDELNVVYADEGKGLDNYTGFDLRPYEIDALIYLPGRGTSVGASKIKVEHKIGGFKWIISMGEEFNLVIEDWGKTNAFKDKLAALKNQDIFEINFIQQTDSFAFYEAKLNANGKQGVNNVGVLHHQYFVVALEHINGVNYLLQTSNDGTTKEVAQLMANSAQNMEFVSSAPKFSN